MLLGLLVYLRQCAELLDGTIPLDRKKMWPNEVFWQRPENAAIKYNNHVTNLRNTRHRHTENKNHSAGLAHDRRLFPKATHNYRNEPRWDEGGAQRWLRDDMDADQHMKMSPMELNGSRDEYVAYSPAVFGVTFIKKSVVANSSTT
jgi:hypothetical protein